MTTAIRREDLHDTADRIAPYVHRTPVMTSRTLDALTGARVFLKCENLQRAGSFKIRGAANHLSRMAPVDRERGVVCHSSGNHAQAVALAARTFDAPAHVVMPRDAPAVKRRATIGYGARVIECASTIEARGETAARVIEETGGVLVHPYDHDFTIMGQATATLELLADAPPLDFVFGPVSGGGLLSGTALAAAFTTDRRTKIVGVEPALADDAVRSFQAGHRVDRPAGPTIADGLRAPLCERTFDILHHFVEEIVSVEEAEIAAAMRLLWERAKLVVEPSGAAALAGLIKERSRFGGRAIGVIVSGGNVDVSRTAAWWSSSSADA